MELLSIDRARVVPVEVTIYVLPVLDVLPQPGKLVEPDRSTAIGILRGQSRILRTLYVTSNGRTHEDRHEELHSVEVKCYMVISSEQTSPHHIRQVYSRLQSPLISAFSAAFNEPCRIVFGSPKPLTKLCHSDVPRSVGIDCREPTPQPTRIRLHSSSTQGTMRYSLRVCTRRRARRSGREAAWSWASTTVSWRATISASVSAAAALLTVSATVSLSNE